MPYLRPMKAIGWAPKGMLVLVLTLAACTGISPEAAPPVAPAPAGGATQDDASTAPAPKEGGIELLTFDIQQSTFLSHIQSAIGELAVPGLRYFVEFTAPDGTTWQGERLVHAHGEVVFLQRSAGDGLSGVRLEFPAGADEDGVLALLPDTQAPAGGPPNVEVRFVRARLSDTGQPASWTFDVTVEHPDTGWEDYADGWHVETADGQILGTRILLHPHVGEQPFTRNLGFVILPDGVNEVRIRPHDLVSGYGPASEPIPLTEAVTSESFEVVR